MFLSEFIDVVGILTFCYSAVPEIKATSVVAEIRCSEVSHYPISSRFEKPECDTIDDQYGFWSIPIGRSNGVLKLSGLLRSVAQSFSLLPGENMLPEAIQPFSRANIMFSY